MSSFNRELRAIICAPQRHNQRRDQRTEKQPDRRQPEEQQRHRQPRQQRVRERIGHQRQPPQDHERAEKAIGEAHQRAADNDAPHEFVMKGFSEPVHGEVLSA
ncbi:MAG: hypothetical protein WDN28_17145 [Chthoniobacter sp.]